MAESVDWEKRLDDHEKAVGSMLLALAGGLLAFSVEFGREELADLRGTELILVIASIVSGATSLVVGAWRTWLRTGVYMDKLAKRRGDDIQKLLDTLEKISEAHDERIAEGAKRLLEELEGRPDEEVEQALGTYLSENPDAQDMALQLTMAGAEQVLTRWTAQARQRLMRRLEPVQVSTFVMGALAISAVVLLRLLRP